MKNCIQSSLLVLALSFTSFAPSISFACDCGVDKMKESTKMACSGKDSSCKCTKNVKSECKCQCTKSHTTTQTHMKEKTQPGTDSSTHK